MENKPRTRTRDPRTVQLIEQTTGAVMDYRPGGGNMAVSDIIPDRKTVRFIVVTALSHLRDLLRYKDQEIATLRQDLEKTSTHPFTPQEYARVRIMVQYGLTLRQVSNTYQISLDRARQLFG